MVDNVIVSNAPTSINADIPVRTSITAADQQIQHVRLDIGVGTAESQVSTSNPLPVQVTLLPEENEVQLVGVVNEGNSTTTPLGSGGVFTGTAMELLKYAVINVNVNANVDSATNGLSVQFSPDGTNWDHSHSTTYTAGGKGYIFNVEYKFARVVFTNGASAQSTFRLQTILKPQVIPPSLYTLDQTVSGNMFAQLGRSQLVAKTPGGTYTSINCTAGGNLKVAVEEINDAIAAATLSNVAASATSVQLLAANANRKQAVFYNDSDKNAYVKLGTTASSTSFSYLLVPGATLELPKPIYTGRIDCIWAAGPTGSMRITEI
jgi:hypothetical protein